MIQQVGLFPHRTIAANIATVPQLLGWDKRPGRGPGATSWSSWSASTPTLLDALPGRAVGGQQQRVGVARALAADPPVLLMDEPYSAVDPIVRGPAAGRAARACSGACSKTIVLVTHDIDEAIKLADRIAMLNVGGILEQYGPPGELLREPGQRRSSSRVPRARAGPEAPVAAARCATSS